MNSTVLYDSRVRNGTASKTDLSLLVHGLLSEFRATLQSDHYSPRFAEKMEPTVAIYANVADKTKLECKFEKLARQWLEETKYFSSISDIISHPAHMRIIGMGRQAIPCILRRLAQRTELWFWALSSIADEDPVTEDIRGNVQEMRRSWLDWGQENGPF